MIFYLVAVVFLYFCWSLWNCYHLTHSSYIHSSKTIFCHFLRFIPFLKWSLVHQNHPPHHQKLQTDRLRYYQLNSISSRQFYQPIVMVHHYRLRHFRLLRIIFDLLKHLPFFILPFNRSEKIEIRLNLLLLYFLLIIVVDLWYSKIMNRQKNVYAIY